MLSVLDAPTETKWVYPEDVHGWLTRPEADMLRDLARGRHVMEIGSFQGRSTIAMAQVAKSVTSIDHHKGDGDVGSQDSEAIFRANLDRYGAADRVNVCVGKTAEIAPQLADSWFDMAFIDGAHDEASVRVDLAAALKLVRKGGVIAMHDIDRPSVAGPAIELMGLPCAKAERVGVWKVGRRIDPITEKPILAEPGETLVFLALPRRPGFVPEGEKDDSLKFVNPLRKKGKVMASRFSTSLLNLTFNRLWSTALNNRKYGVSHFAMQHDDITPPTGWVSTLIDEMERVGADIMSVVVPIKDDRGLTTTGIRSFVTGATRRLTMTEIHKQLPETFCLDEVLESGINVGGDEVLIVNTGLWVCRFTERWVQPPIFTGFKTIDEIRLREDGLFEAATLPEDWLFSEWASRKGLKVWATRKVPCGHWTGPNEQGREFRNDHVWGHWKIDEGDTPKV